MLLNTLSFRGLLLSAATVFVFLSVLIVYSYVPVPYTVSIVYSNPYSNSTQDEKNFARDLRNSTLGFEKIFAIGFTSRGDRRDTLTVGSSLTDIDITRADAVSFGDMAQKSIYEKWATNPKFNSSGIHALIASQRAHLNVLDHIIENRLSTALVLEDDVDWDYHIKDQVEAIATAFRGLQRNATRLADHNSPYGNSWDVLWLGHCRAGPQEHEEIIYAISNDLTVPPVSKRHSKWTNFHIPDVAVQNDTRVAFKVQRGTCTFGYAVTRQGAQKIVTGLSFAGNAQPFDSAMNDLFRGAIKPTIQAYAVYPPIFSSHRFAGPIAKDSDISDFSKAGEARHGEYTWDIVFSVVQNAQRLLSGATTILSQWPGVTSIDEKAMEEPLRCIVEPTQIKWKDLPAITDHPIQHPNR